MNPSSSGETFPHLQARRGTSGLINVLRGSVQGMTNGRQEFVSEIGPRYDLRNRWNFGALLLLLGPAGLHGPFIWSEGLGASHSFW